MTIELDYEELVCLISATACAVMVMDVNKSLTDKDNEFVEQMRKVSERLMACKAQMDSTSSSPESRP